MELTKCENVIAYKKSLIKSIIKDFREFIGNYGFKYKKTVLKNLRRRLRSDKKAADDEYEDDIEYLQEIIDRLSSLKKFYLKQNKYHDQNTKYWGIETIRYLFGDENKDYELYLINHQQYQLSLGKISLAPNECVEKIRPDLIELMNNYNLAMNVIFNSTRNSNNKRTLHIKTKASDDIDELFGLLIKKHEDISKSLKNINLKSEGVESISIGLKQQQTYIQSPQWLASKKKKKCTINPQNKDNRCFPYSITIALNYQKVSNNSERILKIMFFINNFNWDGINFPPQQQDYERFETNNKSITINILHIPHNTENTIISQNLILLGSIK